jgi:hypothetical protein
VKRNGSKKDPEKKDSKKLDADAVWKKYRKGLQFNGQIGLNDTVKNNENFFIGKQWEGVKANGLPQPVFNFLKRDTLYCVASNTSDNVKITATTLPAVKDRKKLQGTVDIINAVFDELFEHNKIAAKAREFMRNAAVDGDGCMYTFWDADMETGQDAKGGICTELLENTRVQFGNPNDRHVQTQPYILIAKRKLVEDVRDMAEDNGVSEGEREMIRPDTDDTQSLMDSYTDDKCTLLLYLWRDKKSGTIHAMETTEHCVVRPEWDLNIKHYPLIWMNWDYVQDSYHGQAMLTGLLTNQMFVNKFFALTMISQMHTAFPRTVYDKTRIRHWSNAVGAAIGIDGGNTNDVASIIEPAQQSPQVHQLIASVIDYTNSFLGATDAALGNTRPDNTSAIIALQRASSVPMELTKQNLYDAIEDLGMIYLDFIGEYYGKRYVEMPLDQVPEEMLSGELKDFAAESGMLPAGTTVPVLFDFSTIKDLPMRLKLDVGASSYWSEMSSIQTMENLLMQGKIDIVQFLERIPDQNVPMKEELISEIKQQQAMMAQMAPMPEEPSAGGGGELNPTVPMPEGQGYGQLQRAINATGEVPAGIV